MEDKFADSQLGTGLAKWICPLRIQLTYPMKSPRGILAILSLATAMLTASPASAAIVWQDRDPNSGNGPLDFLYEGGDWIHESDFNILIDGFKPAEHYISKIQVSFYFADDQNDDSEYVDVVLGNQTLWNNAEVDGNHSNAPSSFHKLSMDVTGVSPIFDQLSTYGTIDYKVTIQNLLNWRYDREDTYLKIAHLEVEGGYKKVPDAGATVALMGLGLLGLAAARKRFR